MPTKRTHIARQQIVQPSTFDLLLEYAEWVAETAEARRWGPVRVPRKFLDHPWSPAPVVGKGTETESS